MAEHLDRTVEYLLAQSWQIAVLVVMVALLSWVLRNRSAHIRYLLWLVVLAKCLVPPALEVPVAVLPAPKPQVVPEAFLMAPRETTVPATTTAINEGLVSDVRSSGPSTSPPLSLRQWLAVIWMAGATIFAFVALTKAARTAGWLRRQRQTLPVDLRTGIEALLPPLGVKRSPRIWLIEGIGQPFVWGLARGEVYLPTHFTQLEDQEHQRDILGHELSHILRFDASVNTLQIVAQAVFWFHPFVWWANLRIRQEREKCCDEMAIARFGAGVKSYSTAIINTVSRAQESARRVPSLAIAGSLKHIEERIRAMMTPGKKFYKHPSLVAATATVLIALLTVPTALVLTARAQTEVTSEQEEKPPKSLHEAIEAGDLAEVKRLIAKGADLKETDERTRLTPLGVAAYEGNAEIVKVLLENGANVELADSYYTPLYYAIWSDDTATIKALIAGGANVNVLPDKKDYPPLAYAIWQSHSENVKTLLDAGAKLDHRDQTGHTLLYYAAFNSGRDVLDVVLAKGNYEETVYIAACQGQLEKVKTLLKEGTDVDAKDEHGNTPLRWAVLADSPAVAKFLLAKGADANASDNFGETPILAARGSTMVGLLIDNGADVDAKTRRLQRTKLHDACFAGDRDVVVLLVRHGADIHARDFQGETPLYRAASHGHLGIVKFLAKQGADTNVKIRSGITPLWAAASGGHADVVEFLIGKGTDVNVSDNRGRTPLSVARQKEHTEVVDLLRQHGAKETLYAAVASDDSDEVRRLLSEGQNINATDSAGRTPLHLAAARGSQEMVKFLLANNADIHALDDEGYTPLGRAARRQRKEVVELLLARGANINELGTTFHSLAWGGRIEMLDFLLEKGADIDPTSVYLTTPLREAVYNKQYETVKFLISKGADVHGSSRYSGGPVFTAVERNDEKMIELLIANGADITRIMSRETALHRAMARNMPEMVRFLLTKGSKTTAINLAAFFGELDRVRELVDDGADVNAKDGCSYSPLHCAVLGEHKEAVEFLIRRGANINAKTLRGWTPVMVARPANIVRILLDKGADVNVSTETGVTALHVAVNRGNTETVKLLVENGANTNFKCPSTHGGWEGWTPFHVACRNGNPRIVGLLLAHGAQVDAKTYKNDTPISLAKKNQRDEVIELLRKRGAKE